RVLHVAGRVLGRHVERVETVPLVFNFGPFHDRKSHACEDFFHAIADDGQRMPVAQMERATGERHVEAIGSWRRVVTILKLFPPGLELAFQPVCKLTEITFPIRRSRREALHPVRHNAVAAAQISIAYELCLVPGLGRPDLAIESGENVFYWLRIWQRHG